MSLRRCRWSSKAVGGREFYAISSRDSFEDSAGGITVVVESKRAEIAELRTAAAEITKTLFHVYLNSLFSHL